MGGEGLKQSAGVVGSLIHQLPDHCSNSVLTSAMQLNVIGFHAVMDYYIAQWTPSIVSVEDLLANWGVFLAYSSRYGRSTVSSSIFPGTHCIPTGKRSWLCYCRATPSKPYATPISHEVYHSWKWNLGRLRSTSCYLVALWSLACFVLAVLSHYGGRTNVGRASYGMLMCA